MDRFTLAVALYHEINIQLWCARIVPVVVGGRVGHYPTQ